jgi:hypothetical protein
MLRCTAEWQQYELDQIRHSPNGYVNNIGIVNAMVRHVHALGKTPLQADPLIGLDHEIRLAKALNVRLHIR